MNNENLYMFSKIEMESPVNKIINQIRDLINSGYLKPGDMLPPERKLCEKLCVGRTHLRDAIKKLEFYGILKTFPQNGTKVAGLGIDALELLIMDVLAFKGNDLKSLIETRIILETNTVRLAAKNRTEVDLDNIEKAIVSHRKKVEMNIDAIEEDLLFHFNIAKAGKNSVLASLVQIITPNIIRYFKKHNVCKEGRAEVAILQHEEIYLHIREQNPDFAETAIRQHLKEIIEYIDSNTNKLIMEKKNM